MSGIRQCALQGLGMAKCQAPETEKKKKKHHIKNPLILYKLTTQIPSPLKYPIEISLPSLYNELRNSSIQRKRIDTKYMR
ncbi:MAG: hypothetical protein SO401_01725 [Blautia sp.]|nr:hypothetical protein [Blautia sp.]